MERRLANRAILFEEYEGGMTPTNNCSARKKEVKPHPIRLEFSAIGMVALGRGLRNARRSEANGRHRVAAPACTGRSTAKPSRAFITSPTAHENRTFRDAQEWWLIDYRRGATQERTNANFKAVGILLGGLQHERNQDIRRGLRIKVQLVDANREKLWGTVEWPEMTRSIVYSIASDSR